MIACVNAPCTFYSETTAFNKAAKLRTCKDNEDARSEKIHRVARAFYFHFPKPPVAVFILIRLFRERFIEQILRRYGKQKEQRRKNDGAEDGDPAVVRSAARFTDGRVDFTHEHCARDSEKVCNQSIKDRPVDGNICFFLFFAFCADWAVCSGWTAWVTCCARRSFYYLSVFSFCSGIPSQRTDIF